MDSDDTSIIVGNFCSTIEQTIGYLDAQWYNITATTALVYGIPSLLLNIRIYTLLFMYRKKKEFSSPFYVVFVIASVVVRHFIHIL
uniref:Serpentine receptor class gamma n=1 Tax=Acrobeloides nanus TaxID=290746 RepID=A0A914EBD0_9BILA